MFCKFEIREDDSDSIDAIDFEVASMNGLIEVN